MLSIIFLFFSLASVVKAPRVGQAVAIPANGAKNISLHQTAKLTVSLMSGFRSSRSPPDSPVSSSSVGPDGKSDEKHETPYLEDEVTKDPNYKWIPVVFDHYNLRNPARLNGNPPHYIPENNAIVFDDLDRKIEDYVKYFTPGLPSYRKEINPESDDTVNKYAKYINTDEYPYLKTSADHSKKVRCFLLDFFISSISFLNSLHFIK